MCLCHLRQSSDRYRGNQGHAPQPHHGGLQLPPRGQVRGHSEGQGAQEDGGDADQSVESVLSSCSSCSVSQLCTNDECSCSVQCRSQHAGLSPHHDHLTTTTTTTVHCSQQQSLLSSESDSSATTTAVPCSATATTTTTLHTSWCSQWNSLGHGCSWWDDQYSKFFIDWLMFQIWAEALTCHNSLSCLCSNNSNPLLSQVNIVTCVYDYIPVS